MIYLSRRHTNFQFVDPWNYKHPLQMPKRDDATSSSSSAAAAEAEISHSGNENGEDEDENQTEKNNASTIVSTGKSQGIFARMRSWYDFSIVATERVASLHEFRCNYIVWVCFILLFRFII